MINTQEKSGFFADNSGWMQPLVVAFILLVAPKIAQIYGGLGDGFLIPLCSVFALIAVFIAGLKARSMGTLLTKVVSHLAVLVFLFLAGVQLFRVF